MKEDEWDVETIQKQADIMAGIGENVLASARIASAKIGCSVDTLLLLIATNELRGIFGTLQKSQDLVDMQKRTLRYMNKAIDEEEHGDDWKDK